MPELSRFFGIIIRMFSEIGGPHHVPHFHAYYQENVAIFGFDPIILIAGSFPKRQQRFVEHQVELIGDWNLLQERRKPLPIKPLA